MNGEVSHKLVAPKIQNSKVEGKATGAQNLEQSLRQSTALLVNGHTTRGLVNGIVVNGGVSDTRDTHQRPRDLQEIPLEIRQQLEGAFLPLATLIGRSTRQCWSTLSALVTEYASDPIKPQLGHQSGSLPLLNGIHPKSVDRESEKSTNRKDRILNFAQEYRQDFIKLLVLLQWSQHAEDVKVILHLNLWLMRQRNIYHEAAFELASIKRRFASNQIPKGDLTTAAEIVSGEQIVTVSLSKYAPPQLLGLRGMVATLEELNLALCSKVVLHNPPPSHLQKFQIRDGRITFTLPTEFDLELSLASDDPTSQYYFVDFRFLFSPCSELPDGALSRDISVKCNSILREAGLAAVCGFLHDLTLTYKINVFYKEALSLAQGQWSSHIRVELVKRTLIVQYWASRPGKKSWFEIGIVSRTHGLPQTSSKPMSSLSVKWVKEHETMSNTQLEIDHEQLSVETILKQVLAHHVNSLFDTVYERLSGNTIYSEGDLLLEQSASATDPGDCIIEMELARNHLITIMVEPVSGSIVLRPLQNITMKTERELAHSVKLSDDVTSKILGLRAVVSERNTLRSAAAAGWQVSHLHKPTLMEQRSLFTQQRSLLRSTFIRPSFWNSSSMLAATFTATTDSLWIMRLISMHDGQSSWSSQLLESEGLQRAKQSQSYFSRLDQFASGILSMIAIRDQLASLQVKFTSPGRIQFKSPLRIPELKFEFDARRMRQNLGLPEQDRGPGLNSAGHLTRSTFIGPTVTLTLRRVNHTKHKMILGASGGLHVSDTVLHCFRKSRLRPLVRLDISRRRFYVQTETSIGESPIGDVLKKLLQLDNILASLNAVLGQAGLSVTELNPEILSVRYSRIGGHDLGFVINLEPPGNAQLTLSPANTNPHSLIRSHLEKLLNETGRTFSENLKIMLPLLAATYPLLSALQQDTGIPVTAINKSQSTLQRKVLVRHPTMYALQYFVPPSAVANINSNPPSGSRMVVRLEILPCQRQRMSLWLLRPAIEEFESYTRPSFSTTDVRERLRKEIFARKDDRGGWLPLGQGAACSLHRPSRLLSEVDRVVNEWFADAQLRMVTGASTEAPVSHPTKAAAPPSKPVSPNQKRNAAGGKVGANKSTNMTKGRSAGKPPEVITLD